MIRKIVLILAAFPAPALAFEAVDALPPSSRFPAYGGEPAFPREFWAQAGVLHDDNALRTPTKTSETIARYGVGASAVQRIYSRQSVRLEAHGEYFDYDQFNQLDYFGYGLLGEWLWELGNPLSGTLGYARTRTQADLGDRAATSEDLITGNHFYGTAAYRFAPDWRLRGAFDASQPSRPERPEAEVDETSLAGGIDYVTPLGNALGIQVRAAEGDAPVSQDIGGGTLVNNDFKEREVAAVVRYVAGATLRLDGRLGRTKREYSDVASRDFDDTTWRVGLDWAPGTKSSLRFETYKVPSSIIDVGASHIVVRGVAFGASWAATAKLVFAARVASEERDYAGDPATALGTAPLRKDDLRLLRLAVGWEPVRRFRLGLGFATGERTSNEPGADYDYASWMVNLRYNF